MKKLLWGVLFIAIFTGLILYRRHETQALSQAAAPPDILRIEAIAPRRAVFEETVSFSANIEPEEKAAVVAKAQGKTVLKVLVEEGAQVREGQKLAVLDDSLLRQQVLQAEAAVGRAASYAATARADYSRMTRLFKQKAVSRQQFDHVEAEFQGASRQEQEARAALASARILLGYSTVTAPISGILLKRSIDPGDTTGAAPAFVISRQARVKVTGSVPERLYASVKAGQKVRVRADALPHREFEATVSQVHPSLDPVTRTGKVDVLLDSEGLLKPGMFARVTIAVGEREAWGLPLESIALLPGTGERICYVVSEDAGGDKAVLRKIETGSEQDNIVEVRSGLASGDRIVAVRSSKLRDGIAIEVTRP